VDPALLPYLSIRMSGVARHAWGPGDALLGLSADSPRLWLVTAGRLHARLHAAPGGDAPFAAEVTVGEALLLPENTYRDVRTPHGACWLSVGLTATLFGAVDLLAALGPPRVFRPPPPDVALISSLLERLCAEQGDAPPWRPGGVRELAGASTPDGMPRERTGDAAALLLRDAAGRAVFALLWRELGAGGAGLTPLMSGLPAWLSSLLSRVAREPSVALTELAAAAGVTDVQMRRAFRRHLGITPSDYLLRARLDAACRLLETTDQSVAAVAGRVGFESLSYFTRLFKRTYGHTPAQHRRPGA